MIDYTVENDLPIVIMLMGSTNSGRRTFAKGLAAQAKSITVLSFKNDEGYDSLDEIPQADNVVVTDWNTLDQYLAINEEFGDMCKIITVFIERSEMEYHSEAEAKEIGKVRRAMTFDLEYYFPYKAEQSVINAGKGLALNLNL